MNARKLPHTACALRSSSAVVCALALCLCVRGRQLVSAQEGKSEKEDTYTIRGSVVNSLTHAPVGHALVYSIDNRFAKMTDDQGNFEFKVQRPDSEQQSASATTETFSSSGVMQTRMISTGIVFMARKLGYFQSQNGQPWMAAEATGSSEVRISLVPEALIIGRVNLPANDGTDKIRVEVYRREVQEGRGHWVSAGIVSARANGEFRVAQLREGEYKLFTQELLDRDPLVFEPRGPLFGYPPVYYPAAADFENATAIRLKAGETFSAILTPSRREYYPVKLGVLNAAPAGGFRTTVEPRGHRGPGYSLGYDPSENTLEGMLPNGDYSVEVTEFGENGATGVVNFSVNGAAIGDPGVMLVPNSSIEVRVKDERTKFENGTETGSREHLNMMNVMLVPQDEFGPANPLRLQASKDQENDTFAFGNALPGHYTVRAGSLPSAYIAAVSSGGRDLLRQTLVVKLGAAIAPVEITIRDDGAQVDGSIENWPLEGREESNRNSSQGESAVVVLLPSANSPGQFRQSGVTSAGEFKLTQVSPGEYRVIAFAHLPADLEYENGEAIRKYEARGQVLRLVAGQNEHLRLALNSESE